MKSLLTCEEWVAKIYKLFKDPLFNLEKFFKAYQINENMQKLIIEEIKERK